MAQTEITGDLQQVTAAVKPAFKHVRPDAKTQRYDRQLRLWASAGQTALESANLLIVNGTATATQTLKNLVLPGIGAFAILDNKAVTAADIGSNFFLQSSSLGKRRAEEQVPLLIELNESVKGSSMLQDIPALLASSSATLSPFTMVISVDSPAKDTLQLAQACWDLDIPLITVRSCGFVGSIRTQVKEMPFIETHPDSLVDLRLDAPWPDLQAYAQSLDFDGMDSAEHGHLPAVVIVLRALEMYKEKNARALPKTTKERNALKAIIASLKKQSDEENFDEATALVVKLAKKSSVPSEIQQLFQDPSCENISAKSSSFWILLRAVREFVQADPQRLLPLTGALPDMKATSAGYLNLQNLYRTKAQTDLTKVKEHLSILLTGLGLPMDVISEEQVSTFVKHAAYVTVIKGVNLRDEYNGTHRTKSAEQIQADLEDERSLLDWTIALRAAEEFQAEFNRWPGEQEEGMAEDEEVIKRCASTILKRFSVDSTELPEQLENALKEVVRAGGADLPQISAILGGIAAQEAIKLITRQYTALNGTLIFDGIKSRSGLESL